MNEWDKMARGEWFRCDAQEVGERRAAAQRVMREINRTEDQETQNRLLSQVLGTYEEGHIDVPFYFDYGLNIHVGQQFYANYGCVFLDAAPIHIGDQVQLGPGVHIYTSNHPLDPTERKKWLEQALPVRIGNNVWIGGGAILCPGVTVGNDAVIAAGAVVTQDVPDGVLVGGNPARVIKKLV